MKKIISRLIGLAVVAVIVAASMQVASVSKAPAAEWNPKKITDAVRFVVAS